MTAWLQTFTGKRITLDRATPDDVCLEDIAHTLSLLCRFGGHCRTFYSVAEHSVRVALLCPPELRLAGLLHDAAEAYVGDVVRPIKESVPEFERIEQAVLRLVERRFGLPALACDHPEIKRWDDVMLATEGRDLMVHLRGWAPLPPPLPTKVVPWLSNAKERFLAMFDEVSK